MTEQKPPKPIADDAYKIALSPKIPFSKDSYDPRVENKQVFYRNEGNKHIPSKGLG